MTDKSAISKILEHRRFVLKEFVDSEKEYVERLRVTVEDYLNHIRAGGPDVPPTMKMEILPIFSTLPEIYSFHSKVLLPALQEHSLEDADAMMKVFLKHGSEFTSKYVSYCKNKSVSDSARLEYEDFFSARQSELKHKLNIEDLLIAPVQRLPRYQLLIRDLLKDTRKVNMDTSRIEEALDLMQKIPKDTNNMITLSLLRGISRPSIVSHGTLWRQESLLFSPNGGKEEPAQVYLFDHQIIVATPAHDGFFHFKQGIKTLNGRVSVESTSEFQFKEEGGTWFRFHADHKDRADQWVTDLQSILISQAQMKRALVYGRPATSDLPPRRATIGLEWSDSDSSVDSMPDSDSDLEGDWPEKTGFVPLTRTPSNKETKQPPNPKKPVLSIFKASEEYRKVSLPTEKAVAMKNLLTSSLNLESHRPSFAESIFRKTDSLPISPRLIRRLLQKSKSDSEGPTPSHAHYPTPNHSLVPLRSPGAFKRVLLSHQLPPEETYFIAIENQTATVAEQVYKPTPGQVFLPLDVSRVEVWKVRILSGDDTGEEVWVQRNTIEEYTAPICHRSIKKLYSFISDLGRGRFSEVQLAKLKSNKNLVAVKVLLESVPQEAFYRELCIAYRLNHDNLVSCQCGIGSGGGAIAMENVNGRKLFDYLTRKSSVTETMVIGLMRQLLDALQYLHSHTIVHMDVRPGNIMIQITRSTDMLKLLDFGAARHYGDESLCGKLEPSLQYEYVAPEVFQQQPIAPGTDLWGFAVIMYITFFGSTPFHGGSNLHTIANITSARYLLPPALPRPSISKEAVTLLKDIFVLSPRKRPSAESAKNYDWFKLSESFKQNKVDLAQLKLFIRDHPG